MRPSKVLVVGETREAADLADRLAGAACEVTRTPGGPAAIPLLAEEFEAVVTAAGVTQVRANEIMTAARASFPDTELVRLGSLAAAGDRQGPDPQAIHLPDPVLPEHAALVVLRALEHRRLRRQARSLLEAVENTHSLQRLIGASAPMREALGLLAQAAGQGHTVLLRGERGTGKHSAARAIHYHSARREGPFVVLSCRVQPSHLVEEEIFGAAGDAPGVTGGRRGVLEQAEAGTVFLDGIETLPPPVQARLARTLQERVIWRPGAGGPEVSGARVIAATERDLKEEVRAGRFREDLFYRIHVFPVILPPLRERRDDIALLARRFLERHARAAARVVQGIDSSALRALTGYRWPGNVRELDAALEHAVAVTHTRQVTLGDLPPAVKGLQEGAIRGDELIRHSYRTALDLGRERFIRDYLMALVRDFEGNVSLAAARAGLKRESLHRLLKRHGIRSDDFRGSRRTRAQEADCRAPLPRLAASVG